MTQNGEQKKKVFLCYAREDQPLMDDFYTRFKNYNEGNFEILYDRHAESRNMHEVFNEFAQHCEVAVLLVNARFVNPSSYANVYEVPVLLERQKEGKVIVVGVRFSNVSDLAKWNEDGDIFFFSLTNNDLPYTRNLKSDDQSFLKEFAVYVQVESRDKDMFHDKLHQWIKDCLHKKKISQSNQLANTINDDSFHFRNRGDLEKSLFVMKPTSLLYKLEKKLSQDKSLWDSAQISIPNQGENWAFWYLLRQADKLEELQKGFSNLTPEDPLRKLISVFEKIEKRTLNLQLLIEGHPKEDEDGYDIALEKHIKRIENALDSASAKIHSGPRKYHTEVKASIFDAVESLRVFLKSLAGGSLGGS